MMTDWPKIKSRRTIDVSPWMKLIAREVEFAPGTAPELYHAVGQQDYIAIVAMTPTECCRSCGNIARRSSVHLGIAGRHGRPRRRRRRLLQARALGRDRLSAPKRASARQLRALHRAAVEPDALILCRDWRAQPRPKRPNPASSSSWSRLRNSAPDPQPANSCCSSISARMLLAGLRRPSRSRHFQTVVEATRRKSGII